MYRLLSLGLVGCCLLACSFGNASEPTIVERELAGTTAVPETPTTIIEATATEMAVATPLPTATQPPPTVTNLSPSPTPQPTATPIFPETLAPICPDLPRPALLGKQTGGTETTIYTAWHPDTNQTCDIAIPIRGSHVSHIINGNIYLKQWTEETGGNLIRYQTDGSIDVFPLPLESNFAILPSHTEVHVAWNYITIDEQTELVTVTLFVTDLATNETVELASINNQAEVDQNMPYVAWFIRPVRFVGDSLLYTIDPSGKGGSWNAYTGRYSNLYRVPLAGGEVQTVYECPPDDHSDCIGDISSDNQRLAVTKRDENQIAIVDFAGNVQKVIVGPGEDYIGKSHFNENGQLVFLSANTGADLVAIEEAWLMVVDVPGAAEPVVISQLASTSIQGWLTNDQFIAWTRQQETRIYVVDLAGNTVRVPPAVERTAWVLR
ncbi:MAG: hypothetical protein AAF614_20215 [Chloroflexota bacterium]